MNDNQNIKFIKIIHLDKELTLKNPLIIIILNFLDIL